MYLLPYSIVIPTFERGEALAETLQSIASQTHPPVRVVLVDASASSQTSQMMEPFRSTLQISYERAQQCSAAQQRNQGAASITTPLIAFFDDDMVLAEDVGQKICRAFTDDPNEHIGGIAARILGETHPVPKRLLWYYYRLQAGYHDPNYGAQLFGPAINCYPSYAATEEELIPAGWLNAGCVFYRTPDFQRERFPYFDGYSFMEDVHLSARIAKRQRLFFHRTACCEHRCGSNSLKRDLAAIARMRNRNQRLVAKEVLGLSGPLFEAKMILHRLFASISIVRRRHQNWWQELVGTWGPTE